MSPVSINTDPFRVAFTIVDCALIASLMSVAICVGDSPPVEVTV